MATRSPQEIQDLFRGIWAELLAVEVDPDDSFFEIGGDSLLVVEVLRRARKEGLTIRAADVFAHPTPSGLADFVVGPGSGPAPAGKSAGQSALPVVTSEQVWQTYLNPWDADAPRCIVPIIPEGEGTPVFVVHWGAGNVKFVDEVAAEWSAGRPVYGIEAAGYRGEVRPFLSIGDMAERYVAELLELQPEGPYHFVGLCHGGVVAVEMAHRLRSLSHEVRSLSLINLDPLQPYVDHGWGVDEIVAYRLAALESRFNLRTTADFDRAFAEMRADKWYDDDVEPSEIMRLQVLWAAHVYALQHYQPRPYGGRVAVFQPTGYADPVRSNWLPSLGNAEVHWYDGLGERLLPIMRHPEVIELIAAEHRRN